MFIVYGCVMSSILFSVHSHCLSTDIKAIDSVGDPPLPIPNREVKPDSADGTANVCGRVGHRHFYKNPGTLKSPWLFCFLKRALGALKALRGLRKAIVGLLFCFFKLFWHSCSSSTRVSH